MFGFFNRRKFKKNVFKKDVITVKYNNFAITLDWKTFCTCIKNETTGGNIADMFFHKTHEYFMENKKGLVSIYNEMIRDGVLDYVNSLEQISCENSYYIAEEVSRIYAEIFEKNNPILSKYTVRHTNLFFQGKIRINEINEKMSHETLISHRLNGIDDVYHDYIYIANSFQNYEGFTDACYPTMKEEHELSYDAKMGFKANHENTINLDKSIEWLQTHPLTINLYGEGDQSCEHVDSFELCIGDYIVKHSFERIELHANGENFIYLIVNKERGDNISVSILHYSPKEFNEPKPLNKNELLNMLVKVR